MKNYFLLSMFSIGFLFACVPAKDAPEGDQSLAEVYNKTLYLSELDGMTPEGISSEDSSLIINAYVDRWVRDAVMMHEAEHNIPKDLNIDKLVLDYRTSLILHNYEKVLVEQMLDSTITHVEMNNFYEKNKQQYQLETPIVRCHFIKIQRDIPNLNHLQELWNSTDTTKWDELVNFSNQNATIHQLEDSTWFKVEDIAAYMPTGTLTIDNVTSKNDFVQRDGEFQYFFRVLELVSKKEIPPVSYIQEQAAKVILHRRKMQILEEMKDKMYEDALRKNNVKVF